MEIRNYFFIFLVMVLTTAVDLDPTTVVVAAAVEAAAAATAVTPAMDTTTKDLTSSHQLAKSHDHVTDIAHQNPRARKTETKEID